MGKRSRHRAYRFPLEKLIAHRVHKVRQEASVVNLSMVANVRGVAFRVVPPSSEPLNGCCPCCRDAGLFCNRCYAVARPATCEESYGNKIKIVRQILPLVRASRAAMRASSGSTGPRGVSLLEL